MAPHANDLFNRALSYLPNTARAGQSKYSRRIRPGRKALQRVQIGGRLVSIDNPVIFHKHISEYNLDLTFDCKLVNIYKRVSKKGIEIIVKRIYNGKPYHYRVYAHHLRLP